MEGYWAQAIFRCFYKALEMTGSINEAAVKKVTFFKGSSYKVTIFKNSEKPTGLHPLLSGIGNERVNGNFCSIKHQPF